MQIASTGKLPPAPLGQGGGLPSKDKCLQTSLENKGAFPLHFGGVPSSPPHPHPDLLTPDVLQGHAGSVAPQVRLGGGGLRSQAASLCTRHRHSLAM